MKMSRNRLLEMVEEFKEKITSEEYKNLANEIAQIPTNKKYLFSIFYIEYNGTNINEIFKLENRVREFKLCVSESNINPTYCVNVEEIVKMDAYIHIVPDEVIEFLPTIYHQQLYHLFCVSKQTIDVDSDNDEELNTEYVAYKTTSVMLKITEV